MSDGAWTWWVGRYEERYDTECVSREEAVDIAREEYDEGAWITEVQGPAALSLSDYFDAGGFLEHANELSWDDHADEESCESVFDVKSEDRTALQAAVRSAIDQWQSERNLKFRGFKFQAQRNTEFISAAVYD